MTGNTGAMTGFLVRNDHRVSDSVSQHSVSCKDNVILWYTGFKSLNEGKHSFPSNPFRINDLHGGVARRT
jgi:hypothetical protein